MKIKLLQTLAILLTGGLITSTGYAETKDQPYASIEAAVTKLSEEGRYNVTLYTDNTAVPMKKIHSWTLHIETKDGEIVEDAKVFVFGGMPAHQHDFPTKPRVKQYLGKGNYKVEGIKFSMPGHWEMRFNIKRKDQRDRVVFDINL